MDPFDGYNYNQPHYHSENVGDEIDIECAEGTTKLTSAELDQFSTYFADVVNKCHLPHATEFVYLTIKLKKVQ